MKTVWWEWFTVCSLEESIITSAKAEDMRSGRFVYHSFCLSVVISATVISRFH